MKKDSIIIIGVLAGMFILIMMATVLPDVYRQKHNTITAGVFLASRVSPSNLDSLIREIRSDVNHHVRDARYSYRDSFLTIIVDDSDEDARYYMKNYRLSHWPIIKGLRITTVFGRELVKIASFDPSH